MVASWLTAGSVLSTRGPVHVIIIREMNSNLQIYGRVPCKNGSHLMMMINVPVFRGRVPTDTIFTNAHSNKSKPTKLQHSQNHFLILVYVRFFWNFTRHLLYIIILIFTIHAVLP